jgi:hypothetical protein
LVFFRGGVSGPCWAERRRIEEVVVRKFLTGGGQDDVLCAYIKKERIAQ